jgi:hypothetical protein
MSEQNRHLQLNTGGAPAPGSTWARPWLLVAALLAFMLLAGGCAIVPVNAGERPNMPVPIGDEQVIAIAPSTAPSGASVAVAGAGWKASEVVYVTLEGLLDGVDLEETMVMTTTDVEGRFTTEFVVPLDIFWQGATDLQVGAYSLDKARSATAPFAFSTVTPTVTMTPTLPSTPTALPTAVATATPTHQATPLPPPPTRAPGDRTAVVISAGLNMRTGPGTNYPVIRALPYGTRLFVLGQDFSARWLYVQTRDLQLGWVARAYTDFTGTAPIVNPPPPPIYPTWTPTVTPTAWPTYVPPPGNAWLGEYFANPSLAGFPTVVRQDPNLDFNWGTGSPAPGIPADFFSARWTRSVYFDEGTYRFNARADDGVRVWVDGRLLIDQWHTWRPETYSGEIWLNAGYHQVVVDYFEQTGVAFISVWWERVNPNHFPDWKGEYYSNRHLDGSPTVVRNDHDIDFNWGTGSPAPGVPNENFSVRWTRRVDFSSGWYRLMARSDDGIRVYVDGDRVIDEWRDQVWGPTFTYDIYLSGHHDLKVEYYERDGGARVRFDWERIDGPTHTPTVTPTATQTSTPTPTSTPQTPTPTPTATRPAPANPYADANPSSGVAGTRVTVSFGNFPPNTTVNLYIGGFASAASADATNAQVYATTSSDRFGRGSLAFTMPSTWPDGDPIRPGQLLLLAATPGFGVSAGAEFDFLRPQPTVAPNPYARANPDSGGAGTRVTVTGGGFPANTALNLFLGGVVRTSAADAAPPVANTVTDGNGNFTASFTMPSQWPDGQPITTGKLLILVATSNFGVEASATFDFFTEAFDPAVSLNPTSGVAGTIVSVTGTGFPAGVNIGVYLSAFDESLGGGQPIRYATGRTDGSGRASLTITMPSNWPNGSPISQDRIVVTMARTDFSVSASAIFTYLSPGPTWTPTAQPTPTTTPPATATPVPNPSARVTPRTGGAGTVVTVTGSGFPANTTLYAHLAPLGGSGGSGNEYRNYATAMSEADGTYALVFSMPSAWPDNTLIPSGRMAIQVATLDFSRQASVSFDYRSVTGADEQPTAVPPVEAPTDVPTEVPTVEAPTEAPTPVPTATPEPPTAEPTATPEPPVEAPTEAPTATSTMTPLPEPPTEMPTETPTVPPVDSSDPITGEVNPIEPAPPVEPGG